MASERIDPLPFRLPVPGRDTIDDDGVASVSYRIEGLLHVKDHVLTLEWSGSQHTQQVSLTEVRDEVDALPVEWADIPLVWLTGIRTRRGWWRPGVELRARRLDAFDGVPGARPGSLLLRIRRRDRPLAELVVAAMQRGASAGARPDSSVSSAGS